MRRFGLFLAMTIATGTASVAGAFLGVAALPTDAGFFGGGLAAGATALLVAARLAVRAGCLPRRRLDAVLSGASAGLLGAAALSVFIMITPALPLLGFLLVGAGAAWADCDAAAGEPRASDAPVV